MKIRFAAIKLITDTSLNKFVYKEHCALAVPFLKFILFSICFLADQKEHNQTGCLKGMQQKFLHSTEKTQKIGPSVKGSLEMLSSFCIVIFKITISKFSLLLAPVLS